MAGAAALLLALAPGGAAASSPPVATGFVAVTNGEGSLQISQFTLDGTPVRRLTSGPADHNYPSLSQDGKEVLYTGEEGGLPEIYRRPFAAGGTSTELTHPPLTATSATWSPDGARIAYSALPPGTRAYEIFVASADGSNAIQLTHTTDSGNTQPVFSPDGSRIAYINGRATTGGAPGGRPGGFANRVWVMQQDGAGAQPLTDGPRDAYPQWLDRDTVLFAREDVQAGTSRIIGVSLDGRQQDLSPAEHFIEPRPLPDGRSYGATAEDAGGLHLVKVSRADGSPLARSGGAGFRVERLAVPPAEGSVFTMSWVLASAQATGSRGAAPIVVYALGALALVTLIVVAMATTRNREKN